MLLFDYKADGITYTDCFIIAWMSSFVVDEIKQVILNGLIYLEFFYMSHILTETIITITFYFYCTCQKGLNFQRFFFVLHDSRLVFNHIFVLQYFHLIRTLQTKTWSLYYWLLIAFISVHLRKMLGEFGRASNVVLLHTYAIYIFFTFIIVLV